MQVYNDEPYHYGKLGMRWGRHTLKNKDPSQHTSKRMEKTVYALGAKLNPRELKYKVKKVTNKVDNDVKLLANTTINNTKQNGVITTNNKSLKAIESIGIATHKKAVYDNLNESDIKNLKTYTDSARYSRNINGYLAIGSPKDYAEEAGKLKRTLNKNSVDNQTVYRSCNLKFTTNGIAKNTKSNQEAILAPNKLTYRKMEFDKERNMFAITVDAS